jgi:hypothetical protein
MLVRLLKMSKLFKNFPCYKLFQDYMIFLDIFYSKILINLYLTCKYFILIKNKIKKNFN